MKNRKFGKYFNLFDIIVFCVVVLLALILLLSRGRSRTDTDNAGSTTVKYTIELNGMTNNSADLIKAGDKLVDKIKKYDLGTVKSVTTYNTIVLTNNLEQGGSVETEYETQKSALIEIEASASESDTAILVDGGFNLKVGLSVSVKGPGYFGKGYIVGIDRGAE